MSEKQCPLCFCLFVILLLTNSVVSQNCRGDVARQRECESVCDLKGNCKIRAALLLPVNTSFYASVAAVQPVFDLALQDPRVKQHFPDWLDFEFKTYDVTDCDAAYAIISAIDAYTHDCAHVFFGPPCDFALASVARISKFLGSTGTPLITTGGFSYDFTGPKLTCAHEYYMLIRSGLLGFKDMAYFIISVLRHYQWNQVQLINEPEGQIQVGGTSTCHLMMKTFANFLKKEDIIYSPWDTTSSGGLNYTENLKFYLGYKYTSKFMCKIPTVVTSMWGLGNYVEK